MKSLLMLAGIGLTLFACQKDTIDAKDSDRIKYQETVTLSPGSLTFAEVNDSRCPQGAQCVWAGNVVVDLSLAPLPANGNEGQTVKMCLGDCHPLYPTKGFLEKDTAFVTYGGVDYTLVLSDVAPYPSLNTSSRKEDYSIKLDINKK